jgi:hypothetical protein
MRSYINTGLKGNGPALRNLIALAQTLPHDEPTSTPPPGTKSRFTDLKEQRRSVSNPLLDCLPTARRSHRWNVPGETRRPSHGFATQENRYHLERGSSRLSARLWQN